MPENSLKNKTDYKRLGDYIREVDSRNRDLTVTKLMGINIGKFFMPSVANVIGTDLSNYKVVFRNCFACNLMHVGRDEKIPIALHDTDEKIIISPAYFVFEISKPEELLPAYLMMWFRRREFDRNAWFYTDSDVRGGMSRDAFCDLKLPIPPLSRQREIVAEYETLTRRIRLNERLISTLESAAQTLYRRTFVDNIDPAHLPPGWRTGTLRDVCSFQYGYTESAAMSPIGPKFLRITDITRKRLSWKSVPYCSITSANYEKYRLDKGDIVVARTGASIGWAKQIKGGIPNAVYASFLIRIRVIRTCLVWLIGFLLESPGFRAFIANNQQGSAQPQANANVILKYPLILPNEDFLCEYNQHMGKINRLRYLSERSIETLECFKDLTLSNL